MTWDGVSWQHSQCRMGGADEVGGSRTRPDRVGWQALLVENAVGEAFYLILIKVKV